MFSVSVAQWLRGSVAQGLMDSHHVLQHTDLDSSKEGLRVMGLKALFEGPFVVWRGLCDEELVSLGVAPHVVDHQRDKVVDDVGLVAISWRVEVEECSMKRRDRKLETAYTGTIIIMRMM